MYSLVLWQRIEGAGVLVGALWVFAHLGVDWTWWTAALIFFTPDLSLAAYPLGPRVGAWAYNLLHLYAVGAILVGAGLWNGMPAVAALGALWLAHAGFDRMLGYGLKSEAGFNFTHLGRIGRDT